jgi:hypothetical protein
LRGGACSVKNELLLSMGSKFENSNCTSWFMSSMDLSLKIKKKKKKKKDFSPEFIWKYMEEDGQLSGYKTHRPPSLFLKSVFGSR